MKISSKFKKIISLMMIPVALLGTVVLPVSAAGQAGDWGDNEYHEAYEDFSDCPKYTEDDLVYDGVLSTDVRTDFNIKKQYGLDWTTDTGFYMSRPFSLRRRWDYGDSSGIVNFTGDYANANQLFSKDKFDAITSSSFVKNNNLDLSSYDVYYTLVSSYSPSREYGYLTMMYYFVPKGKRIAFSNQNKNEDGSGEVKYGLWLSPDGAVSDIAPAYSTIWRGYIEYGTEGKSVSVGCDGFYKSPFSSFLGMSHINLLATNIPVFTKADAAKQYIMSGESTEDPTNKIPDKSDSTEKIGADAFYWDDFSCKPVQVGGKVKFVFNYKYSAPDMVANIENYMMNVDYTQTYKYKLASSSSVVDDRYKSDSTSLAIGASPGTITDEINEMSKEAYNAGQGVILWFGQAISDALGVGRDFTGVNFLNSYITVYVELVHVWDGGNGLKVKDKVSSDIRSYTFDALTLKSLDDTSDIEPVEDDVNVKTKDTVDSDGKVIDRTVESVTVNNNTTYVTNNYYYDSDGNKSTSSGSSLGDSLSDIASGLIKFIKTLVTEGLPAALEILKTLIKSVSDLVGFAFDQIGDIGTGTQNGIIMVLKAIPTPLWGICSVGIIAYVIVGVVKKFF